MPAIKSYKTETINQLNIRKTTLLETMRFAKSRITAASSEDRENPNTGKQIDEFQRSYAACHAQVKEIEACIACLNKSII